MDEHQDNHRQDHLGWAAGIFFLLALSFAFNLWPPVEKAQKNPLVEPQYFSKAPVRKPMTEPVIEKDGHRYRCNDCHQNIAPSSVQKSFFSAHDNVVLQHGVNNYCTTCHSKDDREYLVDMNNSRVPFSKSEVLCLKCHGNIYRDWEKGAHGRMNDHWDDRKGEVRKLTCAACHDPHQPQFQSLHPAPPPHKETARE